MDDRQTKGGGHSFVTIQGILALAKIEKREFLSRL